MAPLIFGRAASRWALAHIIVIAGYGIGQAIIFLPCGFVLLLLLLLLLRLSFFPRIISAAADWMSTILLHLVWPQCEFRMQVWNVLHAARWKCRTQKSPKIRRLGTIAQFCRTVYSQLRHVSTIGKILLNNAISPHAFTIWWTSAY